MLYVERILTGFVALLIVILGTAAACGLPLLPSVLSGQYLERDELEVYGLFCLILGPIGFCTSLMVACAFVRLVGEVPPSQNQPRRQNQ